MDLIRRAALLAVVIAYGLLVTGVALFDYRAGLIVAGLILAAGIFGVDIGDDT